MSSMSNMHVISANSCVYRDSESKATQLGSLSCIRNQTSSAYQGLRSLKNLGKNQTRVSLRTSSVRKYSYARKSSSSAVVCESETEMRVVFVGTEVAPWSKTGGLGEVLGSLPPALAARGHRVMTVTPRYDQYSDAWDTSVVVEVKIGDELHNVRYFHSVQDGVDRIFVDHPMFLEKVWGETGPLLYGSESGDDYVDNSKRFSLLCQAALEAPRVLNLKTSDNSSETYGEDVIFVCNDWHTSLLPCFLRSNYQSHGIYTNAKSVLCIHNISFQGRFPFSEFRDLGLPQTLKSSFDFIDSYTDGERKANWLKAGILEADKVLTVSPHHAKEVVSDEFKGMELENIIRNTGITGILNGMNVQNWNPSTDKYIPVQFDSTTVMDAKPIIKEALQAEVGLPVDRNIPLLAYIGRLEEQKGSDILSESIPGFSDENFQLVALGTGNKIFEKQLEDLEDKYPNKARGMAKYNAKLAHMIIAGADFVIIPSRFEPCGLIQMEAMQYGTVPIVSSTGGLVDSVKEGYTGFQIGGFNVDGSIVDPKDVEALTKTVKRAIKIYDTPAFTQITKNCMEQDFSWKEPARNWEKVLQTLDSHGKQANIDLQEIAPAARKRWLFSRWNYTRSLP